MNQSTMGKNKTLATPAEVISRDCLAVRVRALNRAVSSIYDEALREHGVRVGQLNLLVAVARQGVAAPGAVCNLLRMEKSTLSRDVEVLRRQGWLEVVEGPGRARPLRVTPAGHALLEAVLPAWRRAQAKARRLLGEEVSAAVARISLGQPSGTAGKA